MFIGRIPKNAIGIIWCRNKKPCERCRVIIGAWAVEFFGSEKGLGFYSSYLKNSFTNFSVYFLSSKSIAINSIPKPPSLRCFSSPPALIYFGEPRSWKSKLIFLPMGGLLKILEKTFAGRNIFSHPCLFTLGICNSKAKTNLGIFPLFLHGLFLFQALSLFTKKVPTIEQLGFSCQN